MPVDNNENPNDKKKKPEEIKGNFLVLSSLSETITSGSKMVVMSVVKSEADAVNYIEGLTSAMPEYVCLVEKKRLFSRKPQIVVTEIK